MVSYPIIKRRIAWLVGAWVSGISSPVIDPIFWEVLVHLLCDRGAGTDAAVRFTAANSLRECVDVSDSFIHRLLFPNNNTDHCFRHHSIFPFPPYYHIRASQVDARSKYHGDETTVGEKSECDH